VKSETRMAEVEKKERTEGVVQRLHSAEMRRSVSKMLKDNETSDSPTITRKKTIGFVKNALRNVKLFDDERPEKIVINFFPMSMPSDIKERGESLRDRWSFESDKPSRSQCMKTTLQSNERVQELELRKIRNLLGIPTDNVQYNFVFIYPNPTSMKFLGGYVYFQGPWKGLNEDTAIVGANMLIYSNGYNSDTLYAMNLVRVECGLLFEDEEDEERREAQFEEHVKESLIVEGEVSVGVLPDHENFSHWRNWATTMAWIQPLHAQGLARNVNDSVLAGQSGSFLFIDERETTSSLARKYSMYSMVVRKMMTDPPHVALQDMPRKQSLRIARLYLKGKIGQPEGVQPRLVVLLGGSGAGKSSILRRLSSATDGAVDPKNEHWVLSGLDEFIEFVPEYRHAVDDITVGYANAATYAYRNAIKIATAANVACMRERINMIFEDTGKCLSRTIDVIRKFGKDRVVTVILVDNAPDVAIARAAGRFQVCGRFSSPDYIRGSFENVFEHYLELKRMTTEGKLSVDHFIYNDNHNDRSPMWLDGGALAHPLAPVEAFEKGPVEYRPHYSVLLKMVKSSPDFRKAYEAFVRSEAGEAAAGEASKAHGA